MVADFGCGSGETLKFIDKWAAAKSFKVKLAGIDNNALTCDYASRNCIDFPNITIYNNDFREDIAGLENIDIGISCLFCHHLSNAELKDYLVLMRTRCKTGFVINDLHRHPLAYYSIAAISKIAGTNMLRHDAPLSVLRAFKKNELNEALQHAGIRYFELTWQWAFRYLVTAKWN